VPHRRGKDDKVVHRAAQRDANEDPQQPRQETKLRRQHRTDERPSAGNRRKVMAEQHPAVGRHIVFAVAALMGRGLPIAV
jgi:hypothetical protein